MSENPIELSVVVPVYKSEESLDELVSRLNQVVDQLHIKAEILLVEDAGPDGSWQKIEILAKNKINNVKGLRLSRNFGQHYAITAGLDETKGKWIVVMDCDLQDRPEGILDLYKKALEGYDIVLARRKNRQDNLFKKAGGYVFYRVLQFLTSAEYDNAVANFGIYNRKVISAICQMREQIRYFPVMVKWLGFKLIKIDVEHAERKYGKTTYGFRKHLSLATDIILAFSDRPLRLAMTSGILVSFFSLLLAIYFLWRSLVFHVVVPGWASVIISIWFLSGIILFVLGVACLYLGKIFEQVKNRPLYIVTARCGE